MPFRRNYSRKPGRRKVYKKKVYRKKAYRPRMTVPKVKNIVRKMESMSYQQALVTQAISSTPVNVFNVSNFTYKAPAAGSIQLPSVERTSTKLFLSNIRFSGVLQVADTDNRIRLCMFRGKRSNQTANPIAAADCFNQVGAPGGPVIDAPINYRNVQCLFDKTYNLDFSTDPSNNIPVYPDRREIRLNFPVKKWLKYNYSVIDNEDFPINNQNYFMVAVSDSSVSTHPSLRGRYTFSFKNTGD